MPFMQALIRGPWHVIDVLHTKTNLTTAYIAFSAQLLGALVKVSGEARTPHELGAYEGHFAEASSEKDRKKLDTFNVYAAAKTALSIGDIPVCGVNSNMVRCKALLQLFLL